MEKIVNRIIWFCAIGSMVYTAVSVYLITGWFAANSGIELPLWGWMMSSLADILVWCYGQ